jgi:small subunit ribosomal protein S20
LANLKSALKRNRQSETHRIRNRINKTKIKNIVKKAREVTTGSLETALLTLRQAESVIRRAATKGAIHKRTASRKISRLTRFVNLAQVGKVATPVTAEATSAPEGTSSTD